jgi:dihydroorotase
MSEILIKNAQVVNEGKIFKSDILIKGDFISEISNKIVHKENYRLIDAKNKLLIPGVIDDQVHFREPGLTHKATINSESKAAIAGGITSFIEMPNTIPQTTTLKELENKFQLAKNNSYANYSFMFGGTNDNIDEIKKLDNKTVPALKLFLGSSTGNMLVDDQKVLKEIFESTDLLIAVHSEDEKIINNNLRLFKSKFGDEIPFNCHPQIRSEEACLKSTKKIIDLAKLTGARLHVFHLSTKSETLLFDNEIPLRKKQITAEVCVHHLWFSGEDYKEKQSFIKWNPAIKTKQDREALWDALNNDRIDIIATDHAPHTIEEKSKKYLECPSGGPLVQHGLVSMMQHYLNKKITLEKIVTKMCHNPADLFEIEKRGYIRKGYFADLVLIDLNSPWKVDKKNILYKCGWSPFENVVFDSRVTQTFVNGKLVFNEGEFDSKLQGRRLTFER